MPRMKPLRFFARQGVICEKVHAGNHLRAAEKVLSTKENLQEAINGETYEFESMYPPMIEDAKVAVPDFARQVRC